MSNVEASLKMLNLVSKNLLTVTQLMNSATSLFQKQAAAAVPSTASAQAQAGQGEEKKESKAGEKMLELGKKLVETSIGGAMDQQLTRDRVIAKAGNDQLGTEAFERFKKNALSAGEEVSKSLDGSLSLFNVTKDIAQLEKLNGMAHRISAFDSSSEGIETAAEALTSVMSGDTGALSELLQLSEMDLKGFDFEGLAKAGNIDGALKSLDQLLKQQNMSEEAYEKLLKSPAKQLDILTNRIKSSFADAGMEALNALGPLLITLNEAFEAGKFQPFFDVLSMGLSMAAQLLQWVVDGALWLMDVVAANWPAISGILQFIAVVILPLMLSKVLQLAASLWQTIAPILTQAMAWAVANWQILLIVAAIALVILALNYFGVSAEQILGVVVGAFFVLFAMIHNKIAEVVNTFLIFAEFLANLLIDPVYAIKKLFYDLAMQFMGNMYNMLRAGETFAGSFMHAILAGVNGAIKGINWLLEKMNSLFGTDYKIEMFDEQNIHSMSDRLKGIMDQMELPTSDKDVVSTDRYKMDIMSYEDAGTNGNDLGQAWGRKLDGWLDKLKLPGGSSENNGLLQPPMNIDTVNRVGEVGGINDQVEVSSEDLNTMRELAEMKNIQNFVTLTPTVSVQTGNIQNAYDVDTIINRIEKHLEEEFAASAQGVYT